MEISLNIDFPENTTQLFKTVPCGISQNLDFCLTFHFMTEKGNLFWFFESKFSRLNLKVLLQNNQSSAPEKCIDVFNF